MRKYLFIAVDSLFGILSCRFLGKRIHGNGVIKTEEKPVSAFKEVEASGDIKLMVSQGDLKPVKLEGDENILTYIEVIQEGEKIIIKTKEGVNLIPSSDLTVYVSSPNYKSIEVSGSSDIIGQNKITSTDELELQASGAGISKWKLTRPKLRQEYPAAGPSVSKDRHGSGYRS